MAPDLMRPTHAFPQPERQGPGATYTDNDMSNEQTKCLYCTRDMLAGSECKSEEQAEKCDSLLEGEKALNAGLGAAGVKACDGGQP
jgi:hypothetical protein